jgi:glyoxylase-like metal-dependent hydrolase (beta-lactamase superfamily II)
MATAYLIESETGLVLVDTGARRSEERILRKMREIGHSDLALIYITHAHLDHYGSAALLRGRTGAKIAIHRADADDLAKARTQLGSARGIGVIKRALLPLTMPLLKPEPTPPDMVLDDGDHLDIPGLDARVLHTPGHTPGSSSLIVQGRFAFAGDLLSTNWYPHAQSFFALDWGALPKSLGRLRACDPELVYTGHGTKPMTRNELGVVTARYHHFQGESGRSDL